MKVFPGSQTRDEYLTTQIERSRSKFNYCKVAIRDVAKYRDVLRRHHGNSLPLAPILCLGTRSGREIDLFRTVFRGSRARVSIARRLERRTISFNSVAPWIEATGRSDWTRIGQDSVIGVEVNPMAERADTWIGSFDDMPSNWTDRFGVVFSNSFDQSQDPSRTAQEWRRVLRPGGYLILCFGETTEPNAHDPVGAIMLEDVRALFPGDLVLYQARGSANGYSEAILRL